MTGSTRIYQLNPKWFFKRELEALLRKALSALPQARQGTVAKITAQTTLADLAGIVSEGLKKRP